MKKNNNRKLMAIVLAVVFTLALAVPALAIPRPMWTGKVISHWDDGSVKDTVESYTEPLEGDGQAARVVVIRTYPRGYDCDGYDPVRGYTTKADWQVQQVTEAAIELGWNVNVGEWQDGVIETDEETGMSISIGDGSSMREITLTRDQDMLKFQQFTMLVTGYASSWPLTTKMDGREVETEDIIARLYVVADPTEDPDPNPDPDPMEDPTTPVYDSPIAIPKITHLYDASITGAVADVAVFVASDEDLAGVCAILFCAEYDGDPMNKSFTNLQAAPVDRAGLYEFDISGTTAYVQFFLLDEDFIPLCGTISADR